VRDDINVAITEMVRDGSWEAAIDADLGPGVYDAGAPEVWE
jgi:hypothetical protein